MSFIGELKRRNVTKVAMLYAIAAWVVLQVAELLFEALEVPEWGLKLVLGLLLTFFPLVLIFSWVYELTPEGIRREKDVDRETSITGQTGRRINLLIVVLLVAAIGIQLFDRFNPAEDEEDTGTPVSVPDPASEEAGAVTTTAETTDATSVAGERFAPPPDRSIAVLPFASRSEKEGDIYFVDGIHDEVLTRLSQIGALKIISRTSVMEYRDTAKNMRTIGEELQVAHLVEGSVQRAGDRIRVNVQLIDAGTDEHLWAEIYDREMTAANLFEVQSEIARAIAAALHASLTESEQARLATIPTQDDVAYQEYLLGKQEMARRSVPSLASAKSHFSSAVTRDPAFALAHVGLADATYLHALYSGTMTKSRFDEVRAHIDRALALDPDIAEAYASLGSLRNTPPWGDPAAADAAFRRAIKLNPNYAPAYQWYSILLRDQGQVQQAYELLQRAVALDPLSAIINFNVGSTLEEMGRFDEAMAAYLRFHRLKPREPRIMGQIGTLHRFAFGRIAEGIRWYRRAEAIDPDTQNVVFAQAVAWSQLGEPGRLDDLAERERARDPDGSLWRQAKAYSLMLQGRFEEAEPLVQELLELSPTSNFGHQLMNWLDIGAGRHDELIARIRALDSRMTRPGNPTVGRDNYFLANGLAVALYRAGEEDQANALYRLLLDLYEEMPRRGFNGFWYHDVTLHALMGNREAALESLKSGIDEGMFESWQYFYFIPEMRTLMAQPEFDAQMARIRAHMAEQFELARDMEREEPVAR
jgi:TolB-like protein/Tfp pilus assembly protein PilF